MATEANEKRTFVSHVTLRRTLGVLGVLLPILLAVWGFILCSCLQLQNSISDYYALRTRDLLVGVLFAFAFLFFAYKGYERKDDVAGDWAAFFAVCVALFPCTGAGYVKVVHFLAAAGFFLVLAYFAIYLFTKSGPTRTRQKQIRNSVYVTCGVLILICIALIGLYSLFLRDTPIATLKPIFWLESVALWAFGISWFIKGDTLLKDR
jgi:uncharacterized membrane protein YiaA